jgi:hypothetical protein
MPCRPMGILLVAILLGDFAIFLRISVDDSSYHSKFLCSLDLETSEDSSVFGQGNLPLQINTSIHQVIEVLVSAEVYVDVSGCDVATT